MPQKVSYWCWGPLVLVWSIACGPPGGSSEESGASDGRTETSRGENSASSGTDDGVLGDEDLPVEFPECGPGEVWFADLTDVCHVGCRDTAPSCEGAPSCDQPQCHWDMCPSADCQGFITAAELPGICPNAPGGPIDPGPPFPPDTEIYLCAQASFNCNPWTQNCDEGEACIPLPNLSDDPYWGTAWCRPTNAAPLGAPCQATSPTDPIHDRYETDCGVGLFCDQVDDQGMGTCAALCGNHPWDPACPDGNRCAQADPMFVALCLEPCDPRLPAACPDNYVCALVGDTTGCIAETASTLAPAEACQFPNECGADAGCLDGALSADCSDEGCCASYCTINAGDCGAGATCSPVFESDTPSGLEDLGICSAA